MTPEQEARRDAALQTMRDRETLAMEQALRDARTAVYGRRSASRLGGLAAGLLTALVVWPFRHMR